MDSYVGLCQEPWCFHPDQIARLTDWQIVHLYFEPAIERSKQMEAERSRATGSTVPADPQAIGKRKIYGASEPGQSGPDYEPGTPGHRKQIIESAFMGVMGLKREQAERLYEKQLAQWHAEQHAQRK